ncbi:MAG: peptidylprolyl isomerase [Sphingomonas sp.]|nr:MAG: peptidylprolyl isomerase [Sphingomonas sp.]
MLAAPLLAQTTPAPTATPAPPTPGLPLVAIQTTAGRIVVEADTRRAPITAGNFLRYVDMKKLDGVTFYRVVKAADRFGFVQFGVNGDPAKVLPPIKHEPTTLTGIQHLDGVLSTPRLRPGSARGDFTIMLGDQRPSMDADPSKPGDNLGYAAFGRVVEGMDVVLKIFDAPDNPTGSIRGAFRGEVPVAPVRIVSARRVKSP